MGRFVDIGVGSYDHGRLRELPQAVPDVDGLREVLNGSFAGQGLADPDEAEARRHLQTPGYTIKVGGIRPGAAVSPVNTDLLVWDGQS